MSKIKINLNSGSQWIFDTKKVPDVMRVEYSHYESNVKIVQEMVETVYLKREMTVSEYQALFNIMKSMDGHGYHEIMTVVELFFMFIDGKQD